MGKSENNDLHFLRVLFGDAEAETDARERLAGAFPGIIYIYDTAEKKLRYTNPGFTSILGFTKEEAEGWDDFGNLVYKEDLSLVQTEIDRFLKEDGQHSFNCRLNNKEGAWSYFRTKGTVLRKDDAGKPLSLLFIAEDISKEMAREKELLETRSLLSDTEELLGYGQFSWNTATNEFIWSEGMYRIFGYAKEMVPEKLTYDWFLSQVNSEERDMVDSAMKAALQQGTPFEVECAVEPQGLLPRLIVIQGKPVPTGNNGSLKLIGITRDITESRMRDKERERMIRDLHRSNLELEEFAYVASHDLQEPLRKISTFSERLRTRAAEELSPESAIYLNRILASTANMRQLIDNLLEFSRVSRNQSDFQRISLNDILEEVRNEFELSIEEAGVTLQVEPLPELEMNPTHARRLFGNLVNNAIKFRRNDVQAFVKVTASKLSKTELEHFHLPSNKTYFSIQVEDNGIGFEEEYANRIFQIFQRLHGKAEYPGSGLGLAICKKIAENHGGFIYAESTPGKGSRFFIILPEQQ